MSDEQLVFICHTGIVFSEDFFAQQEKIRMDDLMPVIHGLMNKCDGIIKKPGKYGFELKVTKLK